MVEFVPNFKLVLDLIVALLTCKNEEEPIKNEGARVLTRLYIIFSDGQGQLTSKSVTIFCRNSNSSKLLWLSSLPARIKKDLIKNKGSRVLTRFSPLYVYGKFCKRSRAANSAVHGRIWPKFKLVRDFMVFLLTCKNEEDLIKTEGARVLTRLYVVF